MADTTSLALAPAAGTDEERVRELVEDALAARIAGTRVDLESWKLENWVERAKNEVYRDSSRRLVALAAAALAILVLVAGHGWGVLEARLEARAVAAVLEQPGIRMALTQPAAGALAGVVARQPVEVPLGTVLAYSGEPDVKALFARGYMVCNGQRLIAGTMGWTRQEFDALYGVMGNAWGGGVTAAGSRYLHLPDLRGVFLRGVDAGAGRDLDAGRIDPEGHELRSALHPGGNTGDRVGTYQEDTVGRPEGFVRPGKILFHACVADPAPDVDCPPLSLHAPRWFRDEADEKWITPARGREVDTRPRNVAVHWIVRVK